MKYLSVRSVYPDSRVKHITLILTVLLAVVACSTETRKLFFDIQPPSAEDLAQQSKNKKMAQTGSQNFNEQMGIALLFPGLNKDAPLPDIEKVKDWEKVEEMLPKDEEDNVDWSAALNQGLIRPRIGNDPRTLLMSTFQWDFIIKYAGEEDEEEGKNQDDEEGEYSPKEEDAYFPHSAHTQWLSCKNCHMSIYPYRRNPATMKEMKQGASCGVCHGRNVNKTIAFTLKACDRCHLYSED